MLAAVRSVLGQQTDHVAAQNYLKSKLTPAVLKSDKDFFEQFWASFAEQRTAARLKLFASVKGKNTVEIEHTRERETETETETERQGDRENINKSFLFAFLFFLHIKKLTI